MLKILIILAALSCIGIYFNTLPEEKKQKQKISHDEMRGCLSYIVIVLIVVAVSIYVFGRLFELTGSTDVAETTKRVYVEPTVNPMYTEDNKGEVDAN